MSSPPSPDNQRLDGAEAPAARAVTPATRIGFLAAVGLLAALLIVSARSEPVIEQERIGRRIELVELIRMEEARAASLSARVDELRAEIDALEGGDVRDDELYAALESRIEEVAAPAGMTSVRGPGVRTVLADSALSVAPTGDPNDLVIHEQDLQAVINALWAGGAEAMSVNGQRVLSTTAIRCVGNTLLLHGQVYSPPYVIEAIGDRADLRASLDKDGVVERFRTAVKEFQLGFTVEDDDALLVPASEGSAALRVAVPAGDA
jgi:uncharacterized protein YlxW (UPF0749 family)